MMQQESSENKELPQPETQFEALFEMPEKEKQKEPKKDELMEEPKEEFQVPLPYKEEQPPQVQQQQELIVNAENFPPLPRQSQEADVDVDPFLLYNPNEACKEAAHFKSDPREPASMSSSANVPAEWCSESTFAAQMTPSAPIENESSQAPPISQSAPNVDIQSPAPLTQTSSNSTFPSNPEIFMPASTSSLEQKLEPRAEFNYQQRAASPHFSLSSSCNKFPQGFQPAEQFTPSAVHDQQQLEEKEKEKEQPEQFNKPLPPPKQPQQPQQQWRNAFAEPTLKFFNQMIVRDSHIFLGRTGLKVSRICLGTMNFGAIDEKLGARPGQLDEAAAHALLDRFVALGGNFIETGNFYPWFGATAGESERILGSWLARQEREHLVIMTKLRLPMDASNVNASGLSRNHILKAVKYSLARLQTSYIDVLQLSGWDETVSMLETLRHLDELVKSRKIGHIGVCDFKGWQLMKFIDAARMLNLHKCVLYEGEYNLLSRGVELEVADVCRNEKIALVAYAPLKSGFLTQHYNANSTAPMPGSRIEAASGETPNLAAAAESFHELRLNPNWQPVLQACAKIARKQAPNLRAGAPQLSTAQIALRWLLQKGVVTAVCVSCSSLAELEEDMCASSGALALTYAEMQRLNAASSQLRAPYPYNVNLNAIVAAKMSQTARCGAFEQSALLRNYIQLPPFLAAPAADLRKPAAARKPKAKAALRVPKKHPKCEGIQPEIVDSQQHELIECEQEAPLGKDSPVQTPNVAAQASELEEAPSAQGMCFIPVV